MSRTLLYFGPSGIGDWCLIWPSIPALLAATGSDALSIVVPYRNPGNELLAAHPRVRALRWLHRAGGTGLPGYTLRALRLLRAIRREGHAALAISYLSNQADFLLLAAASGIALRIGRDDGRALTRTALTRALPLDARLGKVRIHQAYAGNAASPAPEALFPEALFTDAAATHANLGLPARYVALGIGGGRNAEWRFWPAEHYRALAAMHPDRHFVLLGGGATDRAQAAIVRAAGAGNVTDLVGRVTMREALHVVRGATALIGNDSGLANIAATLKVPTLCLYGPSDPTLTGPALLGADVAAIPVPCGPCFGDDQDPATARACAHRTCLSELRPDQVAAWLDAHPGMRP